MGVIFLVVFALAEIALVVLTFTKFGDMKSWLKNRAIIRATEVILLLCAILLPTTHMKWRFFFALGIVSVRFLFDGIMWLIKHKNASGMKKKPWSIINCILSVFLIAFALVPAFIFTNYNGLGTTGEYRIAEADVIFVDESREDPFENDGSFREVPAHFYYPEDAKGECPLVLFSHGAFGYYQSNYSTYAELASHGYVVVALDHPHHSFFTEDTDGNIVTVDTEFINSVMVINEETAGEKVFDLTHEWLKLRVDDEKFVLDSIKEAKDTGSLHNVWHKEDADDLVNVLSHIDLEKIGLIGHSLGGASSVALGRTYDDIDAAIDLDGTMFGEIIEVKNGKDIYNSEPYPIPVLDFTKESDYNEREQYQNDYGYPYVNEYVTENAKVSKTVVFTGAGHMDFTDLPLFSPFLSKMLGSGDVDHEEMMRTVNQIVLNWFDYYLKNEGTLDFKAQY